MFFRDHYILRKFDLGDLATIDLSVPFEDGTLINVQLSKIPIDKLIAGQKEGDIRCIATVEKQFTARQTAKFENLTDKIPDGIRQTISPIIDDLRFAVKRGVRVFMWKRGLLQVHNFIRNYVTSFQYSLDGNLWKSIPAEVKFTFEWSSPTPKSSELAECNKLLSEFYSQPLGHELLSEAWSLKDYSFRSSLVIGIAAAETGFKECVNDLMPDAGWLITNIPSPPLERMIMKYLPTFRAKRLLWDKVLPPSQSIMENLVVGITKRNEVSHGKETEVTREKLTEILKCVLDLLYLLDYYRGHAWALQRIRPEKLAEMKTELDNPKKK